MDISKIIDQYSPTLIDIANTLWNYSETAFEEEKSSAFLCDFLEENGFKVQKNIAGLKTAFTAEYGSGSPVIGLLAEYDALPGLSQSVAVTKQPVPGRTSGHGCGHNLLGTGSVAAALAIKQKMDEDRLHGTLRLYGTPAEELLLGKVIMAKAGVFDDADAVLAWHPERYNALLESRFTAVNSVKFHFHGKTAHAAVDPYNGRSALDAVELLNISANYLREHVPKTVSLHYSTLIDPLAPNIVPAEASAWYFVRAANRKEVEQVYERLCRCAFAAAEMTDTTCEKEFLGGCSDYCPNRTLESVIWDEMKTCSLPAYSAKELKYIEEISKGFESVAQSSWDTVYREYGIDVRNKPICDFWAAPSEVTRGKVIEGSMDLGDVSHIVPTAQLSTACYGYAITGHSWQVTSYAGYSIGHKGMLKAGEILAKAAVRLFKSPDILRSAKEEFIRTNPDPYISPLPDGFKYN